MLKKFFLKFITACVCISAIYSFNPYVFASDIQKSPANVVHNTVLDSDSVKVVEPNTKEIHSLTKENQEISKTSHSLNNNVNLKDNHKVTFKQSLKQNLLSNLTTTNTTVTTYTYSATIETQGQSLLLYPIYIHSNEILQVQLDCPLSQQLDYDLYLYEFDMSTGNLNSTPIDYSIYGTYFNGSKTLSENVGSKNNTSSDKAYCIEVYAKQGGSINEQFTVTIAISKSYDAYETDESAFHAYSFTVGTGGSSLSSRSISSPIDNDWYYITVPSSRNYDAMNFSLDSASKSRGYKVEVYSVGSNNQMELIQQTTFGNVSLNTGNYYFRVYTTNDYLSSSNYTLTLKPVLRASKIIITGYNSKDGPNDYPSYYYGTHYRITGNSLTINGVVATSDNYAVANANVLVLWQNTNWNEQSGNRERSGTCVTNDKGEFSITLTLPPSIGSISQYLPGAISFTHYYDLCYVGASLIGNSSINASDVLYHFAYSMYEG